MKLGILSGIVIWILLISLAKAETLLIVEVGVSHRTSREFRMHSRPYFRKIRKNPKIRYIRDFPNVCAEHMNLAGIGELYKCFNRYAYLNGFWVKGFTVAFVLPPIYEEGKYWTYGAAYIGGHTMIAGGSGVKGMTAFAHEYFHCKGAGHVDTEPNLMHPDAGSFLVKDLGKLLKVLSITRAQIREASI